MSNIIFNNIYYHYLNPYNQVLTSFSLNISTNWKTGLIGRNGEGKTTLFNLLCKDLQPSSGNILVPDDVVYFPNIPKNSEEITFSIIKENIAPYSFWEKAMNDLLNKEDNDSLLQYAEYLELFNNNNGYIIDSIIEKELIKIGLTEEISRRPFNTLSGGEQTRALIISLFLKKGSFPLLDEPTDHLDFEGREKLASYLSQSKKGFIISSHDRYFLDACVDHIVSLKKSNVEVMNGNYSVWKVQKEKEELNELRKSANLQKETMF